MNRRDFVRAASATTALASWQLWAAPPTTTDSRLVVVFLRGAYDALSAVVPYAEGFYHEARPNIGLKRPDKNDARMALTLDGRWALHPAMANGLMPLWESSQLAFVPFAGTGFVSRSHFQAQDWVEFGQAHGERMDTGSGFLNRLLVELGGRPGAHNAVGFTQALPVSLRGEMKVANAPLGAPSRRRLGPAYEELLQSMYVGHPLQSMVTDGLGLRRQIASELRDEMQAASRQALPAGGFALEAARMGRLLREQPQYKLGFVDVGGWDTHAGQGAEQGVLANRLQGLADGLGALADSLGPQWRHTVVVVLSEFGRTFHENGSRGTDHGHGSTLWVLGGSVAGGALRGEQADISPTSLHEGRDLPVLNEYRNVLGGLLMQQFGLGKAAIERVFPGSVPRSLNLL